MKKTGELLKRAREERGLSLHEVALFLKINSRVLQAIEDGDQANLPARTFLRGFVQSYAKFLKLDPAVVLQVFSEEIAPLSPQPIVPVTQAVSTEKPHLESSDEDHSNKTDDKTAVPSLEKSILAKSQVAQDRLNSKTIAFSVLGLVLVVVLYLANNIVKKYKREAEVKPIQMVADEDVTPSNQAVTQNETELKNQTSPQDTSEKTSSPAEDKKAISQTAAQTAEQPAAANGTSTIAPQSAAALPTATAPAANPTTTTHTASTAPQMSTAPQTTVAPAKANSDKNLVEIEKSNEERSFANAFGLSNFFFDTKPKLPTETGGQKASKAQTVAAATSSAATSTVSPNSASPSTSAAPKGTTTSTTTPAANQTPSSSQSSSDSAATAGVATASLAPVAASESEKKEELKIEGKPVEVIVEATEAVEIEYSSSRTSPQKMVLKADQIHTFKSRSGVRLKISNGGAVNIIMNGRDLGAPGAAGQPIQVTY